MRYDLDQGLEEIAPIIKGGKLILLAGSGISVPSGLPTWGGLLKRMIEFCHDIQVHLPPSERFEDLLESAREAAEKHPIRVATALKAKLREIERHNLMNVSGEFRRWLQKLLYSAQPNDNHLMIVQTNYPFVLTTNFDSLLEEAAQKLKCTELMINSLSFREPEKVAACIYEKRSAIVHLHGDILSLGIDDFVFTIEDYQRLKRRSPGFSMAVQSFFLHYSSLFVGYGGNDPNIEAIIEDLRFMFDWQHSSTSSPRQFFVLPEMEVDKIQEAYRHVLGIDIIVLKSHDQLTDFLKEVQQLYPRNINNSRPAPNNSFNPTPR